MSNQLALPPRGFEDTEYAERTSRAQQAMQTHGIDALLLTTEADFRYFSGFLSPFWQSPTRTWYLLVPASGKPVAVIPGIGAAALGKTWIEDVRTWSSPHPTDDGIGLLTSTVIELLGNGGVLGVQGGPGTHLRMPALHYAQLCKAIGDRIVDSTDVVQRVRYTKSEAEIAKLKTVCGIASTVFDRVPEFVSQGMSEIEVFGQFKINALHAGADDCAFLVGTSSPGGYGDIISPPTSRALQDGDVLIMDTGCVWDGYYSDFDRNFAIGHASEAVQAAYNTVWQATEAGLEAVKPGITCRELFNIMATVMSAAMPDGVELDAGSVGRLGHGLGIQLTEPPSITSFDDTVLEAGMVMTLEPGYEFAPGHMMVHEENVVVRENGCELISRRAAESIVVLS